MRLNENKKARMIMSEPHVIKRGTSMESASKKINKAISQIGANSPFSREEARYIWEKVSTNLLQHASGQVRSLIGTVNPSSIYRKEQVELLMSKNILGLDELNLRPRYGFK